MPDAPVGDQTPPVGNEVVGFTTADAKRVAEATKYVERYYRLPGPTTLGPRAAATSGLIAKTTTSVSARSGATYGTGTAQPQSDGGSSLSDDTDRGTITVKNVLNKTIASGSYIIVAKANGSWWVVAVDDCGHLT